MELFPTIHTNFWDAVIAVPFVMIVTQLIKKYLHIKPIWVPSVALLIGLILSIFIAHRGSFPAGVFMGWFYGYAAIGSFSSLKTSLNAYKQKREKRKRDRRRKKS